MLKCRDLAKRADSFLEQRLSPRQQLATGFHLLICGNCRAFMRQMKQALQIYPALGNTEASDDEVAAVVKAIRERDQT